MPNDERQYWKKRSIYRVPTSVTELNRKAFHPQAVSFGPYHYGKTHLRTMEDHKRRALLQFLRRSGKPLDPFLESLREVAWDLEESYDALDLEWKEGGREGTDRFLKLMITDRCFMLEILRAATQEENDYEANDPIFHTHGMLYMMPYIWPDMLMLENQLPMLVQDRLVAIENNGKEDDEYINKLVLNYCSPGKDTARIGKCLHVLDVVRKSLLLHEKPKPDKVGCEGLLLVRSATELIEHGIRLKKSKTRSLTDISFAGGVQSLPEIVVDEATESMFLNLITFERFHVRTGNEVTSYIYFMDYIIDNECDITLLHNLGIVLNVLGDDRETTELFHLLAKYTTIEPNKSLIAVCNKVNEYCDKPWNKWRAILIQTYFRSPWALLSLIAAIFLFALTIIQTIYAVLSYRT
ncbi:hypothetical protein BT93_L5845 [Corymbia citriodora subsp. variegata]|uniref:Uncharacterized protein n=1 Tax=Corymbia citriodora subsp. variegata TaxID=360336 RepID=A0A8T0CUW7_CORYI|nr:hypothetical protein BT93_L5845 [Corymbia citriodora subsp. variegata]